MNAAAFVPFEIGIHSLRGGMVPGEKGHIRRRTRSYNPVARAESRDIFAYKG